MTRHKWYCFKCDYVAKEVAYYAPVCPACREPMTGMGYRWRPGKKGKRGRVRHRGRKRFLVTQQGRVQNKWLSPEEWEARSQEYRHPRSPGKILLDKWAGRDR